MTKIDQSFMTEENLIEARIRILQLAASLKVAPDEVVAYSKAFEDFVFGDENTEGKSS